MHIAVSGTLGLALAACDSGSAQTSPAATEAAGSGTNSGSGAPVDGCSAEAVADASFSYDFTGWQEYADGNGLRFGGEVPCSVVSVETEADGLATVLDCTSEAGAFQGEILIASTDAGAPGWASSQEVTMRLREEKEGVNYASLELRGADEELLLVALNSPTLSTSEFWNVRGVLDPVATAVDGVGCGGQGGHRASVEFSDADDSLVLFGGQRGVLPGAGNTALAIDLEVAEVVCCSADFDFQLLMRQVEN